MPMSTFSRKRRALRTSALTRRRSTDSAAVTDVSAEIVADAATESPRPDTVRRLLTLHETAAVLRIGRTSAWELVNAGELSAVRIRGKLLVPREEVDRFLGE